MDWTRLFGTAFVLVFLAELGDKTQLAVVTLATRDRTIGTLLPVFLGASAAMVAACLLAVVAGGIMARLIPTHVIRYVAGGLFVVTGLVVMLGKG